MVEKRVGKMVLCSVSPVALEDFPDCETVVSDRTLCVFIEV